METLRARAWLYGRLSADATLAGYVGDRIYRAGEVPAQTAFPYLSYQIVTSTDRQNASGDVLWARLLAQVTLYGQNTPSATLEAAMNRVQTLLHKQAGSVSGGVVFACRRAGLVPLPPEETGGVTSVPLCAEFWLDAQAA